MAGEAGIIAREAHKSHSIDTEISILSVRNTRHLVFTSRRPMVVTSSLRLD